MSCFCKVIMSSFEHTNVGGDNFGENDNYEGITTDTGAAKIT